MVETDKAKPAAGRHYAPFGAGLEAPKAKPGLYLVATPIGNLGDITLRALEVLAGADVIACEDTRVTRKLADRFGIGTPLTSDPGYRLVREAQAAGFAVTAIPGASSVLTALSVAGLPTDRFFFEGFLPPKQVARQKRIAALASVPATLVLFESGPRIAEALADLAAGLGARDAAVCRELTKLHEEVKRAPLDALARDYAQGAETRGEFVIVVAPPREEETPAADVDAMLKAALSRVSVKDAVGEVALATGRPKREVYQRALELSKGDE